MSELENNGTTPCDLVAVELHLPASVHTRAVAICRKRKATMEDILVDLIERFMPSFHVEADVQADPVTARRLQS